MSAAQKNVTLPEGASIQRVGQILLDAWEVGSHQWKDTPLILREGPTSMPLPIPQDAPELFRILQTEGIPHLLVGGVAMLTYVQGRNTNDVDFIMPADALRRISALQVLEQNDFFVRAQFRSVRVDVLLTANPLFKIVAERFATNHRFAELEVPTATVEGLLILKLYALPSLYRQYDWERVRVYESDVNLLLDLYHPDVEPLFRLLGEHMMGTDIRELRKLIAEGQQRAARMTKPPGS